MWKEKLSNKPCTGLLEQRGSYSCLLKHANDPEWRIMFSTDISIEPKGQTTQARDTEVEISISLLHARKCQITLQKIGGVQVRPLERDIHIPSPQVFVQYIHRP